MPLLFQHVTTLLSTLEAVSRRPQTGPAGSSSSGRSCSAAVRHALDSWFERHRDAIGSGGSATLLAVLSVLLPQRRPDRVYGLGKAALVRVLAHVLGVAGTQRETLLLAAIRPGADDDLGAAVERIVGRVSVSVFGTGTDTGTSAVTVDELDDALDRLAARCVFSSAELRRRHCGEDARAVLGPLFRRLGPLEAKWATRCLLKCLLPVVVPGALQIPAPRLPLLIRPQN